MDKIAGKEEILVVLTGILRNGENDTIILKSAKQLAVMQGLESKGGTENHTEPITIDVQDEGL